MSLLHDTPPARTPRAAALAAFAMFIGTVACAAQPATEAASGAAADEKVLATVGSVSITETETLELAKQQLLGQLNPQQRYDLMANTLQGRVAQVLQELEAAEAGVSVEELVAREVEAKVAPVTDADVDAFYEKNQARIGRPEEQIAPQIRDYLTRERRAQATNAWMAALREKYAVTTMLEPPRVQVAADGFPTKGPVEAPVTIVEFSDFQCPYCSRIAPTLKQVTDKYPSDVRFVFRQYPLNDIHPNAQKAAEASLCANEQGKFWEMHDAMFANQRALGVEELKASAVGLGLDAAAFDACLDSGRMAPVVAADLQAGSVAGVSGTPAMFVNGRFVSGAVPFEQLDKLIGEELARAREAS
jgi:protein-disulfide isomerase